MRFCDIGCVFFEILALSFCCFLRGDDGVCICCCCRDLLTVSLTISCRLFLIISCRYSRWSCSACWWFSWIVLSFSCSLSLLCVTWLSLLFRVSLLCVTSVSLSLSELKFLRLCSHSVFVSAFRSSNQLCTSVFRVSTYSVSCSILLLFRVAIGLLHALGVRWCADFELMDDMSSV